MGSIFTFESPTLSTANWTIEGNIFNNNSCEGSGGVLYLMRAKNTIIMRNNLFTENRAKKHGGAIYLAESSIELNEVNSYYYRKLFSLLSIITL